jgi:hypothetical protein
MQTLTFDDNGNLMPYEKIEIDLATLQHYFVDAFPNSIKRKTLFDNYLRYVEHFSKEITPNFTQWINGSFVTQKEEPNDIDFVTFIDDDIYHFFEEAKVLDNFQSFSNESEKLDAFILDIYPKENELYISHSLKYLNQWQRRYTHTKPINDIIYNKGFIQIVYGNGCKNFSK